MATKAKTTKAKSTAKTLPANDWRVGVLRGLKAPVTPTNLAFLSLWQRFEGANSYNNPLNTTLSTKHVVGTWNSSGVKQYDSPQAGIDATVATLLNTHGVGYEGIVSLLRKGNAHPGQLAAAVENSSWDAGHYGAKRGGNGLYFGGHLSTAVLPGLPTKAPSLGSIAGDVAHYTTHPGAGLEKTGGAAANTVKKPLENALGNVGMYILYGSAIVGGGFMMLVALILVGADIGIAKGVQQNSAYKAGAGVIGYRRQRQEAQAEKEYNSRSYRTSREGGTTKVRVAALGPNATKTDARMLARDSGDDIPY